MGTLKDLGYQVNLDEADPFGLDDLVAPACTEFCPEATGQRRLGASAPPLSRDTELQIFSSASKHFRAHGPSSLTDETAVLVAAGAIPSPPQVVAITFEENGQFHSRIIHQEETKDAKD
eukprot:scaffold578_cov167-Amphora_coffeaeformis.AAC.36